MRPIPPDMLSSEYPAFNEYPTSEVQVILRVQYLCLQTIP